MATELEGTHVAMITPFDEGGGLDISGLKANIDWWIGEGVHGLIPSGSAGEFLQLSDEERADVIRLTVEFAAGRVPVVAGASADATSEAVDWTRYSESVGAAGVMVVTPFYSTPTEEEVIAHFRKVAEATSLPVMIYNNPFTTGIDLTPALLARLSEIPNVRYVKDTSYRVRRVEEILMRTQGRMQVFAGILAYESFLLGATGWVSVPANVAPRLSSELFGLAVRRRDIEAASKVNRALWQLMELEDRTGKYVQIPKAALAAMGRPAGLPRLPRLPLTDDEQAELARILTEMEIVPREADRSR